MGAKITNGNMLYNNQYGLSPGHNAVHTIVKLVDNIVNTHFLDKHMQAIFVDV